MAHSGPGSYTIYHKLTAQRAQAIGWSTDTKLIKPCETITLGLCISLANLLGANLLKYLLNLGYPVGDQVTRNRFPRFSGMVWMSDLVDWINDESAGTV